jgi:hypothetical protein
MCSSLAGFGLAGRGDRWIAEELNQSFVTVPRFSHDEIEGIPARNRDGRAMIRRTSWLAPLIRDTARSDAIRNARAPGAAEFRREPAMSRGSWAL